MPRHRRAQLWNLGVFVSVLVMSSLGFWMVLFLLCMSSRFWIFKAFHLHRVALTDATLYSIRVKDALKASNSAILVFSSWFALISRSLSFAMVISSVT